MSNNTRMRKVASGVIAAAMAMTTAVLVQPAATAAGGDDGVKASGGIENAQTGIVWGYDGPHQGSYKIPTQDSGELDGFCIDRGRSYPKQPGKGATYGPAEPWGGHLDPDHRKRLILALMLGSSIHTGQLNKQIVGLAGLIGLPPNLTLDDVAAGVSGVVHTVGASDARNISQVDPNAYAPNGRAVYDRLMFDPAINLIPMELVDRVPVMMRKPISGNLEAQRMLAVGDMNLNLDLLIPELPSFPPITSVPTTSSTTNQDEPPTSPNEPPTTGTTSTSGTTTPTTSSSRRTTPRPSDEPETPEIRTSAGTKSDNIVEPGATIVDTVTYSGLEPGKEYKITGETVDKSTGQKNGNKGEVTFTPDEANGRIDVPIQITNASSDQMVVFENLYEVEGSDEPVAKHEDVNDQSQTVGRAPSVPEIRTSVESSTGNFIQAGTTVNDTVSYRGLTPGTKYRLEARLVCKESGEDTGAAQTQEFTAEAVNGQVVVPNIAVTNPDCSEQVAFEKLYEADSGYLVAVHEDINDAAQTFGGTTPVAKKKKEPAPAPAPAPEKPAPNVIAQADSDSNAVAHPAPAPGGVGGPGPGGVGGATPVGVGGAPAPRQVINSVPSGETGGYGVDLFSK